jgi:hypothetical protein
LQYSEALQEIPIEWHHDQRLQVWAKMRHKLYLFPSVLLAVARAKTRAFAVWPSQVREEDTMSANPVPSRQPSLFASGIRLFAQAQFASFKLAAQNTSGLKDACAKATELRPCRLVLRAEN